MKGKHQIITWLLAVCLLVSCLPLPVLAGEDTVYIRSRADWDALVKSCTLDTWSQGVTVVLACDLVLDGGASIPTFGGTFDGGGHTISGVSVTKEGSHLGLFRYLQPTGTIRNLTVTGAVTPSGDCSAVGGIVGTNRGTITGCTFRGTVEGSSGVGGIAGVNESTGQILNCTVSGSITGGHYTGGITGENYGSVVLCVNDSQVNTHETPISPDLDELDWKRLNDMENVPACTDTGGIAGVSKGILQSCKNRGTVGYPHTGYNVGGIVGRTAGYVDGCTNSGAVRGRKEVGGIAGQMEPYTLLQFQQDYVDRLLTELDGLSANMDAALTHARTTGGDISAQLTAINGTADGVRQGLTGMLDDLEAWGDGTVDTLNDLSARIARVLDQAGPMVQDLETASNAMSRSLDALEETLGTLEPLTDPNTQLYQQLHQALADLQTAGTALQEGLDALAQALDQARAGLGTGAAAAALADAIAALEKMAQAADKFSGALEQLKTALPELTRLLGASAQPLRTALTDASEAADAMATALEKLQQILREQADAQPLNIPKLDSGFYEQQDSLNAGLGTLSQQLETLNQAAAGSGSALLGDLQQVNARFQSIVQVVRDMSGTSDLADQVVDVSQEDTDAVTVGKVVNCVNRGAVSGDINIGGLAGAMAIELDYDPEDDLTREGSTSTSFRYLTRAVLRSSVNYGDVTARKNCVGGAVGRMDLGLAARCENYGDVESTSGGYVGGIAGLSAGAVRDCWVKCAVTGQRYVGGVAGAGTDITGCRVYAAVDDTAPYAGSIAGEADGVLRENLFVSDTLGGVDGISYAGKAEAVAYGDLLALENVPDPLKAFTLTFIAEDTVVTSRVFRYGDALTADRLPPVPEKAGFYGAWEPFDQTHLDFDRQIHAVYTPWTTTLEAQQGDLLAEGSFMPDTRLVVTSCDAAPPADWVENPILWSVTLSEPSETFTALRIRLPDGMKRPVAWMLEDGQWVETDCVRDGSFLRIDCTASQVQLCIADAGVPATLYIALAAAAVLLLLTAVALRRKKRAHAR